MALAGVGGAGTFGSTVKLAVNYVGEQQNLMQIADRSADYPGFYPPPRYVELFPIATSTSTAT